MYEFFERDASSTAASVGSGTSILPAEGVSRDLSQSSQVHSSHDSLFYAAIQKLAKV